MSRIKFVSVLVLLALLLSAGVSAFAAKGPPEIGTSYPSDKTGTRQKQMPGKCELDSLVAQAPEVDLQPGVQKFVADTYLAHAAEFPTPNEPMVVAQAPFADEVGGLALSDSSTLTEWQIYEDRDYAFSLEYPTSWRAEITIDVCHSSPKPEWILRRHTFTGAEGAFDLDIWSAQGMDLSAWLEWMGKVSAPFPVTNPNARVAGYPAVAFVQDEMLAVFFSDGEHVYRFWYFVPIYDEVGLQAYQHLLDTFRLSESPTTGAQIPQSVMQSARQVMGAGNNCTITNNEDCDAIYHQGCCGLSSTFCDQYFPCSRQNGVDKGNCTWYVCYRYWSVPFRGNAGTWWDQVPTFSNWRRDHSPQMNSRNIAVWLGSPGHVAYVPYYSGGTPTIYEMNWCITCERLRPSNLSSPFGYLFWRYEPCSNAR